MSLHPLAPAVVHSFVSSLLASFDALALVAVALLVIGVVASVVPGVPGALLSLAGVLLYWWQSGYAEPGTVALAGFVLLAVLALAVDWLAGAVSARVGGASLATTALAAVAGFLLLFVVGPLGILLGVAGVVFLAEYRRHGNVERGARTAAYATVGLLASTVAQVALTGLLLVAFLVVVFL